MREICSAAIGATLLTVLIFATSSDAGVGMRAPEITGDTWLNSTPKRLAELHGTVTLIEFWTFGCYNCRNVEPHVKEWHDKYNPRGLMVIGVHTPETAFERDVENVRRYVREHHLPYPIVIDNDSIIWKRYGTEAWPAWYLIDKRGVIRYVHLGEGDYTETERQIQALLAED